jgi:hypothetical protein
MYEYISLRNILKLRNDVTLTNNVVWHEMEIFFMNATYRIP